MNPKLLANRSDCHAKNWLETVIDPASLRKKKREAAMEQLGA